MATSLKPPTNLRGTVSDEAFGAILDDATADLPADLVWPLSIMTYAAMRRDSTCDSILQGYTLQMRRATWQLSGRGCDPKVVARVGQDMDLQVVGTDDTGGARVAGVSWPEHLRTALTSTLAYGHMGFELGVEIRDGLARLTTLAERLPQTISQIHADPKTGAFLGVTQDSPIAERSVPQIPARFMAWYCREREGISWQGASLFRSAWAPFLIKRELMRVLATSNRRFGMGVPVMEALPNANVTPEQMQAAQQMASAARVGEQGGAATPPNFTFKLVGLSGGVPDTLAFIRWLDSQITRAAMMQHLELGNNNNGGARALGEAFIDSWTMALETLAEEAAVVATRQIAARLVGWNEGDQEPVPRVIVSGVGSKREVTAESLQLLLSSGALQPDPALEAWIRREYRLPERDGMAQPGPSVKGDTVRDANQPKPADTPASADMPAPVAASRPRARAKRMQATGQGALFAAGDDPDQRHVAASGVGAGHPDSCSEANLTTPCHCGCNGTQHGDRRARTRLGPRRAEQVENSGGNTRLAAMSDDELATVFARLSLEENWDGFAAVDQEMERRERANDWVDESKHDNHWNVGGEPTEQDRQIDALLARGYDFVDAYSEVYGKDPEKVRSQERSSAVGRVSGQTTDAAVRRGYDEWVHDQWLQAEQETRGHLLSREAQVKGVHPVDLFSGPTASARRWASEDLQRWWADNGRLTFTQYRAQVLGRSRDRKSAELTRLGGNAKDFV